jgi:hypothetical protein
MKKKFLTGVLGLSLMCLPVITHAIWLGNSRANVLVSNHYANLGYLIPFIDKTQYIGWFEINIVGVSSHESSAQDNRVSKYLTVPNKGGLDMGIAGRYVWMPKFISGGYFFINTLETINQANVKAVTEWLKWTENKTITDAEPLKTPLEINPGIELIWPHYQTAIHINFVRLINALETSHLDPYFKLAWKIEKKVYHYLHMSIGTYHTKYVDLEEMPWLHGIVGSIEYQGGKNWSVFCKVYYDFRKELASHPPILLGAHFKMGKTQQWNHPIRRYLRNPLDRHIAPVSAYKRYNGIEKRYSRPPSLPSRSANINSDDDHCITLIDLEEGMKTPSVQGDGLEEVTPRPTPRR